MNRKIKIVFIALTVVVPFLIYCVIYYTPMIRNAPFKSTEFVSAEISWGTGDILQNSYNSATGNYQYLNTKDSLVKVNVKLRKNDNIYLHSKANELGFWNLPDTIANFGSNADIDKVPRYVMKMTYQRKSKTVVYYADYNQVPKLKDVAEQMRKLMISVVNDAENRYL